MSIVLALKTVVIDIAGTALRNTLIADATIIENEANRVAGKVDAAIADTGALTLGGVQRTTWPAAGGTASALNDVLQNGASGNLPAGASKFAINDTGGIELFSIDKITRQALLSGVPMMLGRSNYVGVAGQAGFGVGICPVMPAGFTVLPGYDVPSHNNYGNYRYSDGSIMVWVPAFYYKYGTGANGLAVNIISINSESDHASVAAANAAGYALHRAFYDGGVVQRGVFVDKYKCSNNAGTASSVQNGNPLSSGADNNPFSGLTGAPANAYYGVIAAAKTRGTIFFSKSIFISNALAMLSLAHAQASTSTTWCAWYNATNNFPKGCNNNALGDVNDAALTFVSTGNATYPSASKTGSANVLGKTTHNGQNCGVVDANGTIWEISLGLSSDAVNFYLLKPTATMKNVTAGNTLATDAWGATGIAALYDNLGTTFGGLVASTTAKQFGSATQVFDAATSGNAWNAAGAGIPLIGGVGGTNAFGNDLLNDYRPNEMCPLSAGTWSVSSYAGVWALYLDGVRGGSSSTVGFRSACYL